MKEKNVFELLWCFVKERLSYVIFSAATLAVMIFVYFLYEVRIEPILYAMMLCFTAAALVWGVRFFFYCREHRERFLIYKNIELQYNDVPSGKTLPESDYAAMIAELGRKSDRMLTQLQNAQRENIEYYSSWVHQVKAPISVMQMILQSEDTAQNRQLLAELFRIEQYVNMALCYVRLDSVSTDFVFEECDLDKVIRAVIRKFAPQFIGKRLKLSYEPTSVRALTDEKWLLFMLEQILSNAVKYTHKGGITVAVSEDKKISISDTGIGIAKEDLPRIFEKGFTGYNGRENLKSTGLGLYLSKKTADKISAKISASSEVGKGSTFVIDLHTDKLEVE